MQNNNKGKLAYSRQEAAELLGVHLNTIDRHIRQGTIPARKLGTRWIIPASALHAWLEGLEGLEIIKTPTGDSGGTRNKHAAR